ncbi:MAG TPA: hypothetical protein VF169_12500 [Albitalea sp.]|uniref:hypothetical protein n=1 Tax=Piscinibacter sp. TaxID=1903157 RepID=UPI002ED292F4
MTRRRSLLDFAIVASAAVVPVMLGIVLLVGILDRNLSPRYVSARQVAALKTFEAAIVRREGMHTAAWSADAVVQGLPQCRGEWGSRWSVADVVPSRVAPGLQGGVARVQPGAAEIASGLASLDAALLRFSTRANPRVNAAVGLDATRWLEAAAHALDTAFEVPEAPGHRFRLRCADLASALHALTRGDARMLDALAWRGSEGHAQVAHWRPEQMVAIAERDVARRNPWSGVDGCIYLGAGHFVAGARSAQERLCALPAMAAASAAPSGLAGEPRVDTPVDDPRWMVPPSLHAMLRPLDSLRSPSGTLYRLYTDAPAADPPPATAYRFGPNRIALDGAAVDVGFSVDLTIDPQLQALAQKTAACYTGRQDLCRALAIRRTEDIGQPIGHRLLETAMVRMAAVAVIDIASGSIEALAGAMSPCTRDEFDGPGRGAGCDRRLPYPTQYRPDALLNPAVFHDAMPASTIKPIMAAAFLADPEVGARWLAAEKTPIKPGATPTPDSLRGQLMRSDSARFLDRMFCGDKNFAACRRPWEVQASALAFGWNAGCAEGAADCGKQDLLFGRVLSATAESGQVRPLATPVAFGRLMSEPIAGRLGAPLHLMPPAALDADIVRRCAAGADGRRRSDDDWEKCRGGAVVDVVAEGWGQGHARSSALGVAGMMATLAAAANGQAELHRPHLVAGLRGVRGDASVPLDAAVARWGLAPARPNTLSPEIARVILDGLSYSHRAGTARTACEQVFDPRRCKGFDWIAGKTGTPSFPSDGIALDELARRCGNGAGAPQVKPAACSSLRPYKWYVAAWRSDPHGGPWTKAIGVLTERNWVAKSGQVHAAGDHGPNPSAEIAFQVVGRQLGMVEGMAP